ASALATVGATEEAFPNVSEAALLARLPLPIRNAERLCRRADAADRSKGATASIRCELAPGLGASMTWFESLNPPSLVVAEYNDQIQRQGLVEGSCAEKPRAWQEWRLAGIFSGHLLCYGIAGTSSITWTYEADGVIAGATRPDANW